MSSSGADGAAGQDGEGRDTLLAQQEDIEQRRANTSDASGSGSDRQPAPFLQKTWNLVNDSSTDSVISWSPDGNSFVVWNSEQFSKEVLPTSFKHSNFSSFVRQLNIYGFKKLASNRHEFGHPLFQKGKESQLRKICRSSQLPIGMPDSMRSENMWLKTKLQQYMAYFELVVRQVEKWGVKREVLSQHIGVELPAPEANMSLPLMVGQPVMGEADARSNAQQYLSMAEPRTGDVPRHEQQQQQQHAEAQNRQQQQQGASAMGAFQPSFPLSAHALTSANAGLQVARAQAQVTAQAQLTAQALQQLQELTERQHQAQLHAQMVQQQGPMGCTPSEVLQRVRAFSMTVEEQLQQLRRHGVAAGPPPQVPTSPSKAAQQKLAAAAAAAAPETAAALRQAPGEAPVPCGREQQEQQEARNIRGTAAASDRQQVGLAAPSLVLFTTPHILLVCNVGHEK